MPLEESHYPMDWLLIAEKDLERTKLLVELNDPALAGFCLQQAVEKFLKAFLLSRGWKLRRIHDLESLLDDAGLYSQSLLKFRPACQKISAFYFLVRYPSFDAEIDNMDITAALSKIEELIEEIRSNFQ